MSLIRFVTGIIKLKGATDGTKIGNIGDALKVSPIEDPDAYSSSSSKLIYDDMGTATGGVARNTSVGNTAFTTVYSYTGSGFLHGFLVTLEDEKNWQLRLQVDNSDILVGTNGISTGDISSKDIYGYRFDLEKNKVSNLGIALGKRTVWFQPSYPIKFSSSVVISVKRSDTLSKLFKAGLVKIVKLT